MISLNFLFVEHRNKTDSHLHKNEIHNRSMGAKSEFEPFNNWVMILVLGSKGVQDRECLVRLLLCANSISYYF